MISVHFQGKPFNVTVIQVYAATSNAEEAEVERFYEDLQDLLELTPKKYVLFTVGDWNAKEQHGRLGMVLISVSYTMSRTSILISSGTLSIRSSPLNLFLISTV